MTVDQRLRKETYILNKNCGGFIILLFTAELYYLYNFWTYITRYLF